MARLPGAVPTQIDGAIFRVMLAEAGIAQGIEMAIDTTAALKVITTLLSRAGLLVRAQVREGAVLNPMWQKAARRPGGSRHRPDLAA